MILLKCLFVLNLFVISFTKRNIEELKTCHYTHRHCGEFRFDCNCESKVQGAESACIPQRWVCDGWKDCADGSDELDCECDEGLVQCGCPVGGICKDIYLCVNEYSECPPSSFCRNQSLPDQWPIKCDGVNDCGDISNETNCHNCTNRNLSACDCNKVNNFTCSGLGNSCYNDSEHCNGYVDCADGSDEWGCSNCPLDIPNKCSCNQLDDFTCHGTSWSCYADIDRCDGYFKCLDGTDEMNCDCGKNFSCPCFRSNPVHCSPQVGCINLDSINDGKIDCDDASDEMYVKSLQRQQWASCSVSIFRFDNESGCDRIGFPLCDKTTCRNAFSLTCSTPNCSQFDVVCCSDCGDSITQDCRSTFQCEDKSMILSSSFCNLNADCPDKSDEIIGRPGFKCSSKFSGVACVLPQWNLYDQVAHCYDNSDLCFDSNGYFNCHRCIDDGMIISKSQVCDKVIDCHDASDECLCTHAFDIPLCRSLFRDMDSTKMICTKSLSECNNLTALSICDNIPDCKMGVDEKNCSKQTNFYTCESKWGGEAWAYYCDGRPECRNFEDECFCENRLEFCNVNCSSFYPIGDRFCDGIVDDAWIYLNDSVNCPRGFDEMFCPHRFRCEADERLSIDIDQVCDGQVNCEDQSDEQESICTKRFYCTSKVGGLVSIPYSGVMDGKRDCVDGSDECPPDYPENVFSSYKEMIANLPLRVWLWVIATITLLGNFYVCVITVRHLKETSLKSSCLHKFHHVLILNLCVSDSLMGVYLLTIAVHCVVFSGQFCLHDFEWRTSSLCSVCGILAVVSCQASCAIMALLMCFRLHHVLSPFKAISSSNRPWIFALVGVWAVALLIAILPILPITNSYFVHEVWTRNLYLGKESQSKNNVIKFACKLAALTNTTLKHKPGHNWWTTKMFFNDNFPHLEPLGEVGYYGETSVCLPRFFVRRGDNAWEYTVAVITLNFIAFAFTAIGYLILYKKSSARPVTSAKVDKQSENIQKRIARLLFTDFACWIPLCILSYMKLAGVYLPQEAYAISATVLLPINSALNPILYSSFDDYLLNWIKKLRARFSKLRNSRKNRATLTTLTDVD